MLEVSILFLILFISLFCFSNTHSFLFKKFLTFAQLPLRLFLAPLSCNTLHQYHQSRSWNSSHVDNCLFVLNCLKLLNKFDALRNFRVIAYDLLYWLILLLVGNILKWLISSFFNCVFIRPLCCLDLGHYGHVDQVIRNSFSFL